MGPARQLGSAGPPTCPTPPFHDTPAAPSLHASPSTPASNQPPLLRPAPACPQIAEALERKVSRERVGAELAGMLTGPDPITALRLLRRLGLMRAVFQADLPEEACLDCAELVWQAAQAAGVSGLAGRGPGRPGFEGGGGREGDCVVRCRLRRVHDFPLNSPPPPSSTA